jgi:hypothetical protein
MKGLSTKLLLVCSHQTGLLALETALQQLSYKIPRSWHKSERGKGLFNNIKALTH